MLLYGTFSYWYGLAKHAFEGGERKAGYQLALGLCDGREPRQIKPLRLLSGTLPAA